MALPQYTDVLIVGAGPTGLACALSLIKQGCSDITIVDSLPQGQNSSRALVIHAATLEALDKIECARPLVQAGINATTIGYWDAGSFVQTGSFDKLASYTSFPMILLISQSVTERVLEEQLKHAGVTVIRPCTTTDMKANEHDSHISGVYFENGQIVHARCVIGADGARSTVRRIAGVGFSDPDGETSEDDVANSKFSQMVLADVTFTAPLDLPYNGIIFVISPDNSFLIAPLPPSPDAPSEQLYRIGFGIPPTLGTPPHSPSVSYIQSLVDAWGPGRMHTAATSSSSLSPHKVTIAKMLWATRFRIHSAVADTFFTHLPLTSRAGDDARVDGADTEARGGIILLVGDAAHIHPPAGGQGMNLGLRDAVALGPVLAAYVKRVKASTSHGQVNTATDDSDLERSLRDWAATRRGRALAVIRMVKILLRAVTLPDKTSWILGIIPVNLHTLRNLIMRIITRLGWVRMMIAWRLSGLGFID
ncbi:FAD/NAD(P)-binding domain-containing protein [Wolfiporia cocos MD-104 SS10]|uniref:FAD/NAD(P)-binding domain-containing protein n=1 Tax=Wolfiporia cocos (strain MD-104) TaxID=742152 RepID=A0A2H3JNL5_WOLCO|nr:FAD/NAD(P)-binding domain-containing protein [Wolfiporia cocos MD-104 SS10]